MRLLTLCTLLFIQSIISMTSGAEPSQSDVLEKVRQHITPLAQPLGDRLPILTWQSRGFPTGLKDGHMGEVQQLLMDRGISTLCDPIASASKAEEYIPVLKYRQDHGFPVCILPQGWVQIHFVSDRRA